jgi:hypothetical protein
MSEHSYFLFGVFPSDVDLMGGNLDSPLLLAQLINMTEEEICFIQLALEKEAKEIEPQPIFLQQSETDARKDMTRFLVLCRQAKEIENWLQVKDIKVEDRKLALQYRFASITKDYAEIIRRERTGDLLEEDAICESGNQNATPEAIYLQNDTDNLCEIPSEIQADPMMQRIFSLLGDQRIDYQESDKKLSGQEIAKSLKVSFSGYFKGKLSSLKKMGVFTFGQGYYLSEYGVKIYKALKSQKDRPKSS